MDCNLTIKRANKKNQNLVFEILESEYIIQLEEDSTEADLNIDSAMDKRYAPRIISIAKRRRPKKCKPKKLAT